MSDYFGTNLSFDDFDALLTKDDLTTIPVSVDQFVEDSHYLGQPPLSKIQTEIVKYSTQILKLKTLQEMFGEEEGQAYYDKYTKTEIVCQLGKGSGKDHTSRISLAYAAYLLHCLRDPIEYYHKAHGTYIDLVNMAVNAKQAQQVFFDPLKNLLMNSPYFQETAMFEPRVSEIFFFNKPVRMFSGHSEAEGWEGYETLLVVLDEISAFKTDSELKGDVRNKGSASQIYNMAKASVTSRFPEWGKVSLLSFPRFKDDFIQQRYNSVINDIINSGETPGPAAEGNSGRDAELMTWALKASTWEVNPTKTEEQFAQEFRRDPIQSRARFMCEPPEMEDAYFRNPVAVRKAFNSLEDPLNEDGTFKEWFVGGKDGHIRFIHTDLGLKRDRASVGVVHCSGLKEIKTLTGVEKLPIINMDFIKSWQANPYEEIPLSEIRELIVQLCRMFDVAMVTFDQWQSADMIQSLRSMNINADLHTVAKRDYDTLSTAIYDERFRGYWNELLVEDELLKLRLINNTKVDHPTKGSKDLADSIAGATYMCMDNLILDTDVDIEIIGGDEEYYDDMGNDDIIISSIMPKKADPIPDDLADWLELI